MLTPQTPSLTAFLTTPLSTMYPVSVWTQSLTTVPEFVELLLAVQGLPTSWLEWVEHRIVSIEKRGHKIHVRSRYALSALWSGVTLLQECKFLCDVMENSLRASVVLWAIQNNITYEHISNSVPDWKNLTGRLKKNPSIILNPEEILQSNVICEFTFHQIVETIGRNWKRMSNSSNSIVPQPKGFSGLFWDQRSCRDVNKFYRDMKIVRKLRNDVAHSRRLFTVDEVVTLYKLIRFWLTPQKIELMGKIKAYRSNRPNFLEDLKP